ncbi:MAG TPA: anti-sigma factor [Candidatus Dormibacteraeota bacterium]|nr:anti-sigma factor [Candidatus Dormibacteraeota bacterium]
MTCQEARSLLHAFLDDELDLTHSLDVQRHLDTCPACAREHSAQRALRTALRDEALYFRPPEGFTTRAQAALRASAEPVGAAARAGPPSGFSWTRWLWLPAGALAGVLAVLVAPRQSADDLLAQEVVASHIRSLMPGHLADVPSSDQHTVKPWFNGRLDFSPPVKDLADEGFPLTGGRLDYLGGRPIAALVYERRQHIINLMVWPASRDMDRPLTVATRQGYHLLHWTQGGMNYWAVSDLKEDELKQFVRLVSP